MRTVVPDRGPRRKCRVASDSTAVRYGGSPAAEGSRLDGVVRGSGCALAPPARLVGAFLDVSVAVDHLQIGHAPVIEQRWPRRVAMLAPDHEQRHAVVDLG